MMYGHVDLFGQQSHQGPPRRPSATLAPTVWAILSLKTLLLKEILGAGQGVKLFMVDMRMISGKV